MHRRYGSPGSAAASGRLDDGATQPAAGRHSDAHRVPAWWSDAKLGHLGSLDTGVGAGVRAGRRRRRQVGAVGAGATPSPSRRTAEWYENSLRFPDSPAARHHREHYEGRPYEQFAAEWEAGVEQWDPPRLGRTIRRDRDAVCRVRHFKHMDGYWPLGGGMLTPAAARLGTADRDVVGELSEAVRDSGNALRRSTTRAGSTRPSTTGRSDRLPGARRDPARRLSHVRRGAGW